MAAMNTSKPIQIFKAGKHTAMSGDALSFSETDLAATARAYDPAKHEAPIVVGHPKHDAPAYGWVGRLAFSEGGLNADPIQVNADFAEMVNRGAFKKISASFYSPDSPSNPVPGVYYLRHVGFLGAQPPAVKGLRSPEFGEKEEGVIEFADYDDVVNAGLLRGIRDWIIGKFGLDEGEKAIPNSSLSTLESMAQQDDDDTDQAGVGLPAQFSEKGTQVTPEQKAALEAENAKLKTDLEKLKKEAADFAEAEKTRAGAARHIEHVAFAEALVREGKMLPAQKDVAVAQLDHLAGADKVIEFGEGDAKKPLIDAFKEFLKALPRQVEFSELAAGGRDEAAASGFAAPRGYSVDPEKMETHIKAVAFAEKNKCDYITAVKAVERD